MTTPFVRVLAALALLWISLAALAADSEDATADSEWVKQTVQTCTSCHGPKGVSQVGTFPTLAGQYPSYLSHALKGYRDGTRKNAIMNGLVGSMTDAQLGALAKYFARQPSPLHTPHD